MPISSPPREIEVRGFKFPRRPTSISHVSLLGENKFGRWLGVAKGSSWRNFEGSRSGVYLESFVKLVPRGTFWSACFHPVDPLVDVDIILPASWRGDVLEEVDLELDVLRFVDGEVRVRDEDAFELVCREWNMPDAIAEEALATCEEVRLRVEQATEPFGYIGLLWLSSFVTASVQRGAASPMT